MDTVPDPTKWLYCPVSSTYAQLISIEDILFSGKTQFQKIEVIRASSFGICLVLDGKVQSSELDEFVYHEALVHPAMLAHPSPQSVFIAGGGEGATLREILAYPSVKRVVMVDMDKEAVGICKEYLPSWHQGSFDDNRVELIHCDARQYLIDTPEKFDVIVMDVTDPLEGGPSYLLFTQEFYAIVRDKLSPDGVMCAQTEPATWGSDRLFVTIANTIKSVFPQVLPYKAYVPSFGAVWGFNLASARSDSITMSCEEVDSRLAARLPKNLRFYDGITHQGIFSLSKCLRDEIAEATNVITDGNPSFLF